MSEDSLNSLQKTTITNCEQEPIHIIGKAQAHGVIIICDVTTLDILQCSENVEEILGFSLEEILKKNIDMILPEDLMKTLVRKLKDNITLLPKTIRLNNKEFFIIPHLSGESLILDFDPHGGSLDPLVYQEQLTKILNEIGDKQTIPEISQNAVELVKYLFDYDRVMMYQFDEEWNGKVVAEVKESHLESWLGLHYPASDIPKQARQIFLKQGVRIIADVNYKPAAIFPELSPINGKPIDISKSELRAVSPIHIEYLQNMGVGASLTAAIVLNGELWGLLACHHYSPKFINYNQRQSCKFLTQVFSNKLALRTSNVFIEKMAYSEDIRKKLVLQMSSIKHLNDAICKFEPNFTNIVECSGGALVLDGTICMVGKTPTEEQIKFLLSEFLVKQEESLFFTKNLMKKIPAATSFKDKASGVLSIRIGENKNDYLLWFRPQAIESVSWGGKPVKSGVVKDGVEYLSPRRSFEKWTEKKSGAAIPWEEYDFEAAYNLEESITNIIVRNQKDHIKALNDQLLEANKELETFSYSVSHDLRAPLRGIDGYARILRDYCKNKTDDYGRNAINTIINSAELMDTLIEDIISYSKVGQTRIQPVSLSINTILDQILTTHNLSGEYPKTEIIVQEDIPRIVADRRMFSQLLANLVGNALKYSAKTAHPTVELGFNVKDGRTVYFVKDNGIGIDAAGKEKIFEVFSRVAGDDFAGSGVGLAIAKKIIEKHNGALWLDSKLNEGSTFYFSIPEDL
ncbi:ATP-binding protein [Gillisia sp. Hel_I_29]|uniref:ATP-binding protein n=1 Tax=Gillisia sp. Hel_I_29 TaxID=1249975 RepID=UPI000550FA9D|nr:ATP-binding protein [Gillisia sp. Hel_I_29]